MKIKAILINKNDNCVTLTEPANKNDTIHYQRNKKEETITANENIPIWHKIATNEIKQNKNIYKYGEIIATAKKIAAVLAIKGIFLRALSGINVTFLQTKQIISASRKNNKTYRRIPVRYPPIIRM